MAKNLGGLGLVFCGAAIAWIILAQTLVDRTVSSDSEQRAHLKLHPINYFFLACAFFAFHLLFAYLVDRIPLSTAFVVCSVVSMFLTISYLRLVVGLRFAALESGLAQLVYLVLFSYALFNEGWTD